MRLVFIVCALLLALAPLGLFAMQATPSPYSQAIRDGFIVGASRDFQATGLRLIGSNYLSVSAFVFSSDDVATQALPELVSATNVALAASAPLQPASARDLGDEVHAFLTTAKTDNGDIPIGVAYWRDGDTVYLGISGALAGDPLADLLAVGRSITGRPFPDTPIATPAVGTQMHTGGVWDLLPTLADLPDGFVFVKEEEIAKTP